MGHLKEADKWFSRYQRLRHSNALGICKCATCPQRMHWRDIQWGHFIDRSMMEWRFDHKNGGPQCPQCNEALSGNKSVLLTYIAWKYFGGDRDLASERFVPSGKGRPDLRRIASVYRKRFELLKAKRFSKTNLVR